MSKRKMLHLFTILLTLAACATASGSSFAQEAPPHHFASLQFLHPIATSPDPETSTNFRISLLYGRSGRVKGFDLNAVGGVTSGDLQGFAASGFFNRVGGGFGGFAGTFGVNNMRGGSSGIQLAGLANWNEDAFTGLQAAAILNYTDRGFAGVQLSGVLNLNDRAGTFAQISSVANVNAGPFAGVQVSGFLNAANSAVSGGQVALLNYAENMSGVQFGVLNMGTRFHGLKVGIVNTGQEVTGTTIGLINRDRDSRGEWMFYGSNISLANTGYRTVLNHWSSVVSLGFGDPGGDIDKALFLGWNFGRNIPLNEAWDLTIDLGYQHIMPKKSDEPAENDRLQFALQARAIGEYRLKDGLGLFGAVGTSTRYAEYASGAPSETDLHFSAGVVLY